MEDLLPFSDEALVRAVAGTRTPVVSAIGHEPDTPLLDLVADVRASTPTDAAKQLVPDMAEELRGVDWATAPAPPLVRQLVDRESQRWPTSGRRPALADPRTLLDARAIEVADLRDRSRRASWATRSAAPATTSPTSAPEPARSRRWPRSSAGTPSSRPPTAPSSCPPSRPRSAPTSSIRLADGRVLATTSAVEPAPDPEEDHA